MYFFDNANYSDRENVGTLCNIQSAAVPALAMGQITILAILGYMMKKIFNNPDLIESYTKKKLYYDYYFFLDSSYNFIYYFDDNRWKQT